MLQRILGAVLAVLGLGVIAFGVASATVLKESDTVVATARPAGDGTVVVTDPGVLGMVGTDVTVTASVPDGQQVTLVVGRDVDVQGWLGDDAYTRVTGMTDWETLSTTAVAAAEPEEGEEADAEAEEAAPELLDPRGSDLWVNEQTEPGEVTLRWSDRPGPWVLMAAATGAAPAEDGAAQDDAAADDAAPEETAATAPTLQLTWVRDVATPLLWPAVGVGAVLLVVGVVLFVVGRRKQRRAARSARSAQSSATPGSSASAGSPSDAGPAGPAGPTWSGPAAAPWPGTVASPAPATSPAPPPVSGTGDDQGPREDEREGSGTAPVPVAGRFSRRSRLAQRAVPADPEPAEATAVREPVPAPAAPADEPAPTTTGSLPAIVDGRPLTRRELRLQEEERRQAAGSGMGRALRALTGQTPVVPPPAAGTPGAAPAQAEPTDRSRRSAAWRQTWGFDAGAAERGAGTDETTDEGNR
ncbi:hypothetical protein [Isoptericola dokdonensis]|uniref:Uncharacterized protein n=1 Tax=Isoptericola dokdonensis DS-3 TaxID=1300344 RepID=A0A168G2G9_9MICO|nr:hypothetical protein [Isoptericola dokdonensis]ANC32970.1 hypothetical protein I598_3462 [Isoptericola dokdonensis DS-3]